jgi:dipeptidyl aminopeptidase/acylaminoacyl peptidase
LLLVGAKDELVPIFHSEKIHAAFQAQGVTSELVVFENAGHGFAAQDAKKASEQLVQWFQKHLK